MGRGEGRRGLGFGHRVGPVLAHEADGELAGDVAELDLRGARVGLAVVAALVTGRQRLAEGVARVGEPRGVQSRQRASLPESRLGQELELLRAGGSRAAGLRVAVEVHFERVRGAHGVDAGHVELHAALVKRDGPVAQQPREQVPRPSFGGRGAIEHEAYRLGVLVPSVRPLALLGALVADALD